MNQAWLDIIIAILTSLIASIIFFFGFQFIPERLKYRKIRPRIEVELKEVADSLFFFLEIPFRHRIYTASLFQEEIKLGTLTKEDYEIALYNKCLNKSYLFDQNAGALMIVGNLLQKEADQTSARVRQLLMNQYYLKSEEILIIEDINRLLYTYEYNTDAEDYLGEIKVHVVNPTIHYMSENFRDLLNLYIELKELLYHSDYIKRETRQGEKGHFALQIDHAFSQLYKQDYRETHKILKRLSHESLSDYQKGVVNCIYLRIAVEKGDIQKAKSILTELLKDPDREKIVYLRGYLDCIRTNPQLLGICDSYCAKDEIDKWNDVVIREATEKEIFLEKNRALKAYYDIG